MGASDPTRGVAHALLFLCEGIVVGDTNAVACVVERILCGESGQRQTGKKRDRT